MRPAAVFETIGKALVLAGAVSAAGCDREPSRTTGNTRWGIDPQPVVVIRDTVGDAEPSLLYPTGATVLSNGTIAVVDQYAAAVRFFDRSGQLVRTVGRKGEGPGEFLDPYWLGQCATDSLFVWDFTTKRMSVMDSAGELVREYTPQGRPGLFRCVREGRFAVFSEPLDMPPLTDLEARMTASLWMGNAAGDSIAGMGVLPYGETRILGKATQLAISSRRVFVGTSDSAFVDIYDLEGAPVGSFRVAETTDRSPTSREYERAMEARLGVFSDPAYRNQLKPFLRKTLPPPRLLPSYFQFSVDRQNVLWVVLSPPGDSVTRMQAYLETGEMLADLDVPGELNLLEVGDDYILGTSPDRDGVLGVVMYRLRR
jgi:hypothetical protein